MKTLTIKEAIEQGYSHCGKNRDCWQSLTPIDDLQEIDFDSNEEYFLSEKEPKTFTFGKDQITELLTDVIGDQESEYSGRDTDDIYDAIKAIDFSETERLINEAISNHPVFFLTDIKLVYK